MYYCKLYSGVSRYDVFRVHDDDLGVWYVAFDGGGRVVTAYLLRDLFQQIGGGVCD